MVNSNLFRARMVMAGYTQKKLADAIHMSENTLGCKINGKGYFDTKQVNEICEVLGIVDPDEKCAIFLA